MIDYAKAKPEDEDKLVKETLKRIGVKKLSKFLLKTDAEKKAVNKLWETTYNLSLEIDDFAANLNDDILMYHTIMPKHITPAVVEAIVRKRIKRMIADGQKQTADCARVFMPVELGRLESEEERRVADKVFTGEDLTDAQKEIAMRIFPKGIPVTARRRETYIDEDGKVKVRREKKDRESEGERNSEKSKTPRKPRLNSLREKDTFGCKVGSMANKINEAVMATKGVFTKADIVQASGCDSSRVSSHIGFLVIKARIRAFGKGYVFPGGEGASNAGAGQERTPKRMKTKGVKAPEGSKTAGKAKAGKSGKMGKVGKKSKKSSKKGKK